MLRMATCRSLRRRRDVFDSLNIPNTQLSFESIQLELVSTSREARKTRLVECLREYCRESEAEFLDLERRFQTWSPTRQVLTHSQPSIINCHLRTPLSQRQTSQYPFFHAHKGSRIDRAQSDALSRSQGRVGEIPNTWNDNEQPFHFRIDMPSAKVC